MDTEGEHSSKTDDIALLSELEIVNPEIGQRFLEHLVLARNNNVCEVLKYINISN